jgi:hypothetical protein
LEKGHVDKFTVQRVITLLEVFYAKMGKKSRAALGLQLWDGKAPPSELQCAGNPNILD